VPSLSASGVVFNEVALYQVYVPLPLPNIFLKLELFITKFKKVQKVKNS